MTQTDMPTVCSATGGLPKYRTLGFGIMRGVLREGASGVHYLSAEAPLQAYGNRMTDRLVHWAETAPERTFIAQRVLNADGRRGDRVHVSYREMLAKARAIGQALLARGVWTERPVVTLKPQ